MGAQVIGYVRVSTAKQAKDGKSLADQKERIEAYCRAKDLELVDVVVDAGESAGDAARPGFQRVLERLSLGPVRPPLSARRKRRKSRERPADDVVGLGLVATKFDRISRSTVDMGVLLERGLGTKRAPLHLVSESIDSTVAMGRAMLRVVMTMAELERELASERTTAVLAHVKAKGQHLGGVPFGWQLDTSTGCLVERPDQQLQLRLMRSMRESGLSYAAIAAELGTMGVTGARGGRWDAPSVCRALAASQPSAPVPPSTSNGSGLPSPAGPSAPSAPPAA